MVMSFLPNFFDDVLKEPSDLLRMVSQYEGFSSEPYLCPAGVWTIGYGHTKGVTENSRSISKEQGYIYLTKDLTTSAVYVWRYAGEFLDACPDVHLKRQRFIALVSWVFNLGINNFRKSTMFKRIKEGRWEDAANEMLRWNKANVKGKRVTLAGLTKRRQTESHYFLTGELKFDF